MQFGLRLLVATGLLSALDAQAGRLERVVIQDFSDDAMEPFVSRDGRFLFFNTRNDPGVNTNIHFAEWQGQSWVHRGELPGTVSSELDGTPTMSAAGRFCFVSTRTYFQTLVTVYCGTFDGHRVNGVVPESRLAAVRVGLLMFDVDVSADGRSLIFAEGVFSGGAAPDAADLHLARWNGDGFTRDPSADRLFATINTPDLEYAPALSANGLELYFTRMSGFWIFRSAHLFVARRSSVDQPFGEPEELSAMEGFVEGPTLAPDGSVIFHKRVNDHFELWRWGR